VAFQLQKGGVGQDAHHPLPFRSLELYPGSRLLLHEGPKEALDLGRGQGEGLIGALGGDAEAFEALPRKGFLQGGLEGL